MHEHTIGVRGTDHLLQRRERLQRHPLASVWAQRLCVLVGNRRAIAIAVRNNKVAHRFTALDMRLRDNARS